VGALLLRSLRQLERCGAVKRVRARVTIRDPERLGRIAEGDAP